MLPSCKVRMSADDQVRLPEEYCVLVPFPADASAVNSLAPTPDGSPEARKLTFHEPGTILTQCSYWHHQYL